MIYEHIYNRLKKLGVIGLIATGAYAAKSTSAGFMDLHFNRLGDDNGVVISLAHYFEQNGDLCCDPDMTLRVWTERCMAEALTFQMAIPPVYTEVYPAPGKINPAAKKDLNDFLNVWLRNALAQGHRFTGSAG